MATEIITIEGQKVHATPAQTAALLALYDARKGGVASVKGYVPTTGYVVSPVQDIQFISRFSYTNMQTRKKAALNALTLADVQDAINVNHKLSALSDEEQHEVFNARVNMELESIERTLNGVRDDAHRQGHDRCYIKVSDGIKVHLVTEKGEDGLKHPVMTDGLPTVDSIMVSAIFLNVTTIQEGQKKAVNSGAPVLMGKAITKAIDKPGLSMRTISLKADNFDTLTMDHNVIMPEGLTA